MARYITDAVTTNTRSQAFPLQSPRGEGEAAILKTIFVQGTFDTATATLQVSADGGVTFVDVTDESGAAVAFTANGARNIKISSDVGTGPGHFPVKLAMNVASVGGSTSIQMIVYENR